MRSLNPFLLVILCWPAVTFGQPTTTATINGKITYKGVDVPSAKVTITDPVTLVSTTIKTDKAGNFTLPSLCSGSCRIEVERYGFETLEKEIHLSAGQLTTLDLSLQAEPPSGSLAFGAFHDATGKALTKAKLTFRSQETGESKDVTTDKEGIFFVKDLHAGKYLIESVFFRDQTKTYAIELNEGVTYFRLSSDGPIPVFLCPPRRSTDPNDGPIPELVFAPRNSVTSNSNIIDVIEKIFENENELSRWLGTLAKDKKKVFSVIPIKDGASLFVLDSLKASSKVTYTIQRENGNLRQEQLKNQITTRKGATLVGVHHINSSSHLVVFSHVKQ